MGNPVAKKERNEAEELLQCVGDVSFEGRPNGVVAGDVNVDTG